MMFPTLPNCPEGGGGGAPLVPSRILAVLVEETNAEDTSRPECPCHDQEKQPLAGTNRPLGGTVSEGDTRSPCGGGGELPPSGAAGGLPPVDVTDAPALSVEGPRSVPSRIWVVLVDGTMAGDTPGREHGNWRPLAGETRLMLPGGSMGPWLGTLQDVSTGIGDRGLARRGWPVCL